MTTDLLQLDEMTSLLQLVDKLQQAGKIDNLQQVGGIFGCVLLAKKLKAVIHMQIMSYSSQITPIHIPIYFIHLKTHVQGK